MTACLILFVSRVYPLIDLEKNKKKKSRIDTGLALGSGSQIQKQALHQTSADHFLLKSHSDRFPVMVVETSGSRPDL